MRRLSCLRLSLLASLTASGCESPPPPVPTHWRTYAAGNAFTFHAPPDLNPVPVQGMDSFVGKYTSPRLEISFDYGWYSDPLERDEYYDRRWITVDGKRAYLASSGQDTLAIHFPEVNRAHGQINRLTMYVRFHSVDIRVAEAIVRSIDFL